VAPGEAVRLCYEVANGSGVRIDPDIGEVGVLPRNCVSATPAGTTSYTLTARSTDGNSVRQIVLVPVDTSSQASPSDAPGTVSSGAEVEAPVDSPRETVAPQAPREKASQAPFEKASQAPLPTRASILIFTARPGSIAADGPTDLCYAVSGALQVRIEPGLGEVNPRPTLTCLRVAPPRTTTYELTASGRDGREVRQQLVIMVR
jgi:hypothetical protein